MPDQGTLTRFPKSIGLLQGAQSHLHKLGEEGLHKVCFNASSAGQLFQCKGPKSVSWAHMEPSPSSSVRAVGG